MNFIELVRYYRHYIWPGGIISSLVLILMVSISGDPVNSLSAALIGSGLGALIGDAIRMYPGNRE
jgi:hypothetical protein